MNNYRCTVQDVMSGDDLLLHVALGINNIHVTTRARLFGVDTPDPRKTADPRAAEIVDLVRRHTVGCCRVAIHKAEQGRPGWLVTLFGTDSSEREVNINNLLRSQGYVFRGTV